MTTLKPLKNQATSCGNFLVGAVEVQGKEYRIEADLELTWLSIIDGESRQESCVIDEDGDVISDSGECVTNDWTDEDWKNLPNIPMPKENNFCPAKPQFYTHSTPISHATQDHQSDP
jgi:hypothetical protein